MARLIYLLANAMGGATQVIDETGFHGLVDFELSLADPEATEMGADGGSIFQAVDQQLGLRLEAAKRPIEMLVVDRIEQHPTGD
jgi:uncharacterized protein (TIGR03435 family)